MEQITITRHDQGARGEFHAAVAGSDAIGRLSYRRAGRTLIADHTEVPREIGGRGVAASLVEALIAAARAEGLTIRPQCSYVAAAFARHPGWADLLA